MRRVLAVLAIVSVLLAAMLLYRWHMVGRSFRSTQITCPYRTYTLMPIEPGEQFQITWGYPPEIDADHRLYSQGSGMAKVHRWRGLQWYRNTMNWDFGQGGVPIQLWTLIIPRWWLFTLTAIFPALWLLLAARRWQVRRGRVAEGHCAHCGYDLRATPDRCPECGLAAHL